MCERGTYCAQETHEERSIISCLSKIYNPCELVSPVITPLKIIVQDCWIEKLGWNEEVNVHLRSRVEEVLKGFSGGNHLRVNRWLGITPSQQKDTRVSLHVFTRYLRKADVKGKVTVNLVASKCQPAPPDGDTIPCLELLGALLGAQLLNSLRLDFNGMLKVDDEFLWTDSSVALAWINQGRVWVECSWLTVWRKLQLLVECGHGFPQMNTLQTCLLEV